MKDNEIKKELSKNKKITITVVAVIAVVIVIAVTVVTIVVPRLNGEVQNNRELETVAQKKVEEDISSTALAGVSFGLNADTTILSGITTNHYSGVIKIDGSYKVTDVTLGTEGFNILINGGAGPSAPYCGNAGIRCGGSGTTNFTPWSLYYDGTNVQININSTVVTKQLRTQYKYFGVLITARFL